MTAPIRRFELRRMVMYLSVLPTLAVIAAGSDQGKHKSSPAPARAPAVQMHELSLTESVPFPVPPPMALVSEIKCDLKGNIYLVQSGSTLLLNGGGLSGLPVSKLSIASKSTVSYRVPSLDGYRGVVRSHFDVSADGHLYLLLAGVDASQTGNEARPSFFIAKYNDDGSLASYFKLEDAPDRHLQPFRFAMFNNGNALITGTAAQSGESLRQFAAIIDNAGRLIRYVKLSDLESLSKQRAYDSKEKDKTLSAGMDTESTDPESDRAIAVSSSDRTVSAPDGNVYLLHGTDHPRLYAVSPAGEVIRSFDVPIPVPGLTATNMAMASEDRIFVSFGRVQGLPSSASANSDGPDSLISVLSPQTGELIALYRRPADAFDTPACAASPDNFLFVGATSDMQHEQVTMYRSR